MYIKSFGGQKGGSSEPPQTPPAYGPEKCQYVVLDKVLYRIDNLRKNRLWLCVPVCMRSELMKEAHSGRFAGYFSPKGVYSMLAQRYWWDGMYKDIHVHCRSCLACASYQGTGRRVRPPLMPIPVGRPFYHVGTDITELPQTVNGNHYIACRLSHQVG